MRLGRPKGVLNKTTATVKQAIVDAFHLAGGVDYLVKLAGKDPRAFATLLAKILPTDVKVDGDIRHSALFSPEQLRRMADAQEQGTIDITDTATITYPVEGQSGEADQSMEADRGAWPGPANPEFPDGEGGYTLNGETELGSHPLRDSDD